MHCLAAAALTLGWQCPGPSHQPARSLAERTTIERTEIRDTNTTREVKEVLPVAESDIRTLAFGYDSLDLTTQPLRDMFLPELDERRVALRGHGTVIRQQWYVLPVYRPSQRTRLLIFRPPFPHSLHLHAPKSDRSLPSKQESPGETGRGEHISAPQWPEYKNAQEASAGLTLVGTESSSLCLALRRRK